MSNFFANKQTVDTVEEDRVGGGFKLLDTDIYNAVIKQAYMRPSAKGAMGVTVILDIDGHEHSETIYISNAKGELTYQVKKNGKPVKDANGKPKLANLPSYNLINSLCLAALGANVDMLEIDEKLVGIYDYTTKSKVPTKVESFTELCGVKIAVVIQKQVVDKTAKNDSTGAYEPTGETREQNVIVKFLTEDHHLTIAEVSKFITDKGSTLQSVVDNDQFFNAVGKMNEEHSVYAKEWLDKNKGETYVKAKAKPSNNTNSTGSSKPDDDPFKNLD